MVATTVYGDYAPVRAAGAASKLAPSGYMRCDVLSLTSDHVQLAIGVDIASVIVLGDIKWDAIPIAHLSTFTYDAAGAAVTVTVGDANFPAAFVNGQTLVAAGSTGLMAAVDRSLFGKPLWQVLGYASLATAQKYRESCRLQMTTAAQVVAALTDIFWFLGGTRP